MSESEFTFESTVTSQTTTVLFQTSNLQEQQTVINTVIVDKYYAKDQSIPYAYSTVTSTVNIPISGSPTPESQPSTAESPTSTQAVDSTESRVLSVTSSSPTAFAINRMPNNGSGSKSIIGLSIGLPIGLFLLSLIIIISFIYYRNLGYRAEDDGGKFKTWFLSQLYGKPKRPKALDLERKALYSNEDDGQISYRITRKAPVPHVLTPEKAVAAVAAVEPSGSDLEIEKYLYSKPPGITTVGETKRKSKWSYESPLSRWFLTKSVYQPPLSGSQSVNTNDEPKTPAVKLKTLQLLSKVRREQAPNPVSVQYSATNNSPRSDSRSKSSITKQVLNTDSSTSKMSSISSKITAMLPLTDSTYSVAEAHRVPLQHVRSMRVKKSPTVSGILDNSLCTVVKPFSPRLLDEIRLDLNEEVRVLARHSDGWCLVEKHNYASTESRNTADNVSAHSYLNENRGIVPQMCLKPKR
ncbi:Fus1p Ecym_1055 [Eremothecium cymbalariae DBVPG|uniref:SH3 domain-containing protein n=1 Tax=Eremothecium cymbalariae (strain CBS 270.75 / DBVPG 7215 / KCTC 17166 / NRRL Y-17582) TaxID=931890 RepID=G8JMA4_ERECY|nr:hypothetical protein Ecym_1055 [Eremothecium cymbalariae DBVPG\